MDPISATGLAGTIIGLAGTVAKTVNYVNDIKEAPVERAQFACEASNLLALLTALRYRTLDKKEVKETLSHIERVKGLVSLALENDHFNLSLAIKEQIDQVQVNVETTTLGQQNKEEIEREKILSWLSPLDSTSKQNSLYNRRQPGTGDWFLNDPAFTAWLNGAGERILWCPGPPGVGKSSIASLVINRLRTQHEDNETAVSYLFCNYKEAEFQTMINLMAELLRHILQRTQAIPEDVRTLYNRHHPKGTRPKVDDVAQILRREVNKYSRVFIVVDALDECPERDDTRATDDDIKSYLAGRIDAETSHLRNRILATPGLRDDIIETITARAKGMFLLAELHMESFGRGLTAREAREELAYLPEGLDDTYEQIMRGIKAQDDEELAILVLSWIVFAFRPLTLKELQHALAVQDSDRYLDPEGIPDEESIVSLLSLCAGLVTIDEESRTILLVHYTTQEYFERQDIRQEYFRWAPHRLAEACLTYLQFSPFSQRFCVSKKELSRRYAEYWFFDYAQSHWGAHAILAEDPLLVRQLIQNGETIEETVNILETTTRPLQGAVMKRATQVLKLLLDLGANVNAQDSHNRTPLHWAVVVDYEEGVGLLLDHGACVNSVATGLSSPIHFAAYWSSTPILYLCLIREPNLEIRNHLGDTLLLYALRAHKSGPFDAECIFPGLDRETTWMVERVNYLLDRGASAFTSNRKRETTLHHVVHSPELMALFLAKKVDPAQPLHGSTPLHIAAKEGQLESARLLLEHGASVDAIDEANYDDSDSEFHSEEESLQRQHTALRKAAKHGRLEMVRLLLSRGADANLKLSCTSSKGHIRSESILYRTIENVESRPNLDLDDWSAREVVPDRDAIVDALLEYGADFDAAEEGIGGYTETVLHRAVTLGHIEMVKHLLDRGADPEILNGRGETAFKIAYNNNYEIIGIAGLGAKLSVQLFDLTSQVGSARQDVAAVGQDISVFAAVLGHIATTLETPSVVRLSEEAVRTASWITSRAEAIFKELEKVINGIVPGAGTMQDNKSASMSVSKRVKWLLKRQRVVQLSASLESMKLTLQLMLTTVQISGKIQSRRHSVASAATAVQVEDREISVAESLVIAHQLPVQHLRTIEDTAQDENIEDPDTTSVLTTEAHADEAIHKGKDKDTPRDSAVLTEAASVHDVGDSARRSVESLSSAASLSTALLAGKWTQNTDPSLLLTHHPPPGQASDIFPARAATPGASNWRPSENPRASTKGSLERAFERWETLSAHYEGVTSFWIRKLQANMEELDRDQITAQLGQEVHNLSAAGAGLFNAVFFDTRAELDRNIEARAELDRNIEARAELEHNIGKLDTELEDTCSRHNEEITRERELADEALQSRVQLQRDLDREISRFAEERKIRARMQEDLYNELDKLARQERKSKQDLQAELKQERSSHKAELSDATARLEAEKQNKETLQVELDREKERRKRAIQFLTGETAEPQTGRASPAIRLSSASSVSSASTDRLQRPMTPSSATSIPPQVPEERRVNS
ncbi:hypothetical protein V8F06_010040 [Rhypophila decipiens]